MPAVTRYIPITDKERSSYTDIIALERQKRRQQYKKAIDYYLGNHDPQLSGSDAEYNTTLNLVKMTADRTVSFLFPETPVIELDPDTVEQTAEELWIKNCLDFNGGLAFLTKLGLRGFLSGHNFVRVIPGDKYPRIVSLQPDNVTIFWRQDNLNDILWYEVRYIKDKKQIVEDFVKVNADTWAIITYESVTNDFTNTDIQYLDYINFRKFKHNNTYIHTSKYPPIISWAHYPHPDNIYGIPEAGQKELQDLINKIASERSRILRKNADPVDVITGADTEDVMPGGNIFTIANPNAQVKRLTMQGDVIGITNVMEKLIETYLSIARVVLLKGEAKDLQRVTNASIRTLYLDALSKNKVLQDVYTRALKQVFSLALEIGYSMGEVSRNPIDRYINIKYASPLPVDMNEIINIINIARNQNVMSKRTAATMLNLDWSFEKSAMDGEAEDDFNETLTLQNTESDVQLGQIENNED